MRNLKSSALKAEFNIPVQLLVSRIYLLIKLTPYSSYAYYYGRLLSNNQRKIIKLDNQYRELRGGGYL